MSIKDEIENNFKIYANVDMRDKLIEIMKRKDRRDLKLFVSFRVFFNNYNPRTGYIHEYPELIKMIKETFSVEDQYRLCQLITFEYEVVMNRRVKLNKHSKYKLSKESIANIIKVEDKYHNLVKLLGKDGEINGICYILDDLFPDFVKGGINAA